MTDPRALAKAASQCFPPGATARRAAGCPRDAHQNRANDLDVSQPARVNLDGARPPGDRSHKSSSPASSASAAGRCARPCGCCSAKASLKLK